jgi:hypothetical protein
VVFVVREAGPACEETGPYGLLDCEEGGEEAAEGADRLMGVWGVGWGVWGEGVRGSECRGGVDTI